MLTKNPLIIRKEKVSNQAEFELDTIKAIIDVVAKKNMSDQITAAASQFALGPSEAKNLALANTHVGDLNLQKDSANLALFNFLARLQETHSRTLQPMHTQQEQGQPRRRKSVQLSQG